MNNHLVSESNRNIINLESPQKLQGMTNSVELTISIGYTISWFTISIEQGN